MSKIEATIIIPCYNEEKYIANCLQSVVDSDYPKDKVEVLVVDGNSTDKTTSIIREKFLNNYKWIKLLHNPDRIVPKSMNIGINNALGDFIIRIDAHSSYTVDYFSKLINWSKELNAANIGGICKTEVLNQTKKSNSIKKVLSNKFGVGNSDFRIGTDSIKEVDTVPFGCYRKEIFTKYGLYNEKLIRNQDIELNKRILKEGEKIFLVPDVKCTYYARETFFQLAKNNFKNGKWNILTIYYTKDFNSISLRHLIPLIFTLSLLLPCILSIFWFPFIYLSIASLVAYLTMVSLISSKIVDKTSGIFYLIWSFFTLHFSYGFGSLIGILSLPILVFKK